MNRDETIAWCRARGACEEALRWLAGLPASATLADAWEACSRGEWLLWLATTAGVDRRRVVEAACACVEAALAHVPPGEGRPARAIAVARAWARGAATAGEVRAAAGDACDAACGADGAARAAARAAYVAARAADAADADDAVHVRAYAAHAAYAAAAYADDAVSARAQHAALVRFRISAADVEAAMEATRNEWVYVAA